MTRIADTEHDYVDQLLQQWKREREDLDPEPMGIIARISRAAHILERAQEAVFSSFGLHAGGFDVLAALRRAGPPFCLTPTALYHSLLISSGAMTHRVDRLVTEGLVARVPAPNDGRSVLVQLTEEGRARIDAAISAHLENEEELIAVLEVEERGFLVNALRRLLLAHGDHPHAIDSLDLASEADPTEPAS